MIDKTIVIAGINKYILIIIVQRDKQLIIMSKENEQFEGMFINIISNDSFVNAYSYITLWCIEQ